MRKLEESQLNRLIDADRVELYKIFYEIEKIKKENNKDKVKTCAIINAKSGRCSENCAFCAQSSFYKTEINIYPLKTPYEIFEFAKRLDGKTQRFSIVTSGKGIKSKDEKNAILKAIELIKNNTSLECCVSIGIIDKDFMKDLLKAGVTGFHHNLETSKSFFKNICSTHPYEDDVKTVELAKELGFYTCSCGIFGLGENWSHRIELAEILKKLDVDSLPINFLTPIKGTPLQDKKELTPLECLKIIALFRFFFPDKDIRICGGREYNLRQLQPLIFSAGANGVMIGNYLTTKGRKIEDDFELIKDLGLELDENG